MRWWLRLWRRVRPSPGNGDAERARQRAEDALRRAQRRWPEVHAARNTFVTQVEAAFASAPRRPR